MQNKTTIKKTTTETYTLRGERCLWAKINLDISGNTVNVMISSDYGSFNYYWCSCGENPKKFLTTISMDYAMGKLMGGYQNMNEPDWESRIKEIKNMVLEYRKERSLNKDKAREIYDYIKNDLNLKMYEFSCDENMYFKELTENRIFDDLFYDFDAIPTHTKLKHIVNEFWEDIWIPFTNFLKEEIIENQKLFDDIRGTTLNVVHEG